MVTLTLPSARVVIARPPSDQGGLGDCASEQAAVQDRFGRISGRLAHHVLSPRLQRGRCKPMLRPKGVFLATDFGPFPWNPLLARTTRVVGGRKVLFPLPKDDQQIVRYLRERLQAGEFRPVIDRTYPLDDIAEAYRYVDTEQKVGNVVITVA
jgi:hypothetical protein